MVKLLEKPPILSDQQLQYSSWSNTNIQCKKKKNKNKKNYKKLKG